MKFTAVVPVVKYETKTYDVDVSENEKKIIKAYEKWYDDMSDKNQQALIDALTRNDNKFDSDVDNFEDWVNYIICMRLFMTYMISMVLLMVILIFLIDRRPRG